jgi:16S rRNA (cytosine967-C5)-methyltransferase
MNDRPKRAKNKPRPQTTSHAPADARSVALFVLGRILNKNRTLDEGLTEAFAKGEAAAEMESRDRAFCRLLVATVLRRRGQIDDVLARCLKNPLQETPARLLNILRLGAVQILFLETAPHAAVDATVRLAGKHASQRGLINAILRRLDREGRDWIKAQAENDTAGQLNTPDWLWQSWSEAWGEETARQIANCHNNEPALDLTLKPGSDSATLATELDAVILPNGSLRRSAGGRIEELSGYQDGTWWVQDVSATLPARILLNGLKDVSQAELVDLCAAPGGKTAQLAASGHDVTAVDLSGKRLQRLSENLARLHLKANVVTADLRKWQPARPANGVLLDAPCSATGTMRRHPDAAWSKSPEEVERLATIQKGLVEAAIAMLAPDGILVYCTCSLQPEEGEIRAAEMRRNPDLVHLPVTAEEVPGFEAALTPKGDVRIVPGMISDPGSGDGTIPGGNDGFFITRFRRAPDSSGAS